MGERRAGGFAAFVKSLYYDPFKWYVLHYL
jgi:hypothetical protein